MSQEIQIITEKDFFICDSGLMPARLQSGLTKRVIKEDEEFKYITNNDHCTQSCIDFSCSKIMLLIAAVAALIAAFIALCVATGGAAAVAMTCIAVGAAAGAGGAIVGGIAGALLCGQKAAPARKWLDSKDDFILFGINTITSDYKMICTVFSFIGLPPANITHAPNVTSWTQAITQGATNFFGKVFEGMALGACIGACVGGLKVFSAAGWSNAGRTALNLIKAIPGNIKANYLMSLGKFGSWTSKGIKLALGIRGGMGAFGAAQSYGQTGDFFSLDTLAGFGKGIVGVEIGTASALLNIFTGKGSLQDATGLMGMMLPVAGMLNKKKPNGTNNTPKPRSRSKLLAWALRKPKKVTLKMIQDAKDARARAIAAADDLPSSSTKTIASDGILSVSGFVKDRLSQLFRKKHQNKLKDVDFDTVKAGSEGYEYGNSGARDNGNPGSNKGCHAEKQVIADTNGDPTGVSKPMCPCCQNYANHRVQNTNNIDPVVVADPDGVYIFEHGKDPVFIPEGADPTTFGYE